MRGEEGEARRGEQGGEEEAAEAGTGLWLDLVAT